MILQKFASGALSLALAASALAGPVAGPGDGPVRRAAQAAADKFEQSHEGTALYRTAGRVTSVYGQAFSFGATPAISADAFRATHADLFGISAAELVEGTLASDGVTARPMMPDLETGRMKFTLVSYLQQRDGIPVFRADLRLLVRNDPNSPLVLARSNIRDLGAFRADQGALASPNVAAAFTKAMQRFPGLHDLTTPRFVIWAGVDSDWVAPRLALEFTGVVGNFAQPGYERQLVLADAATGAVLWTENQVCYADVTGSVKGVATPGKKSDTCAVETLVPLPYAAITGPSGTAFADINGIYSYPAAGPASLTSGVRGKWFRVLDAAAGSVEPEALAANVNPPATADFIHNQTNTSATALSSVNAYLQANVARDFTLRYSPTFPTIGTQTDFKVNINVSGACNAFFDGSSINFYPAFGACPSTAFGDVVWHEYGHNLIQSAGSGQGGYGEGMADVMGILISDDPVIGYGFYGSCNAGLRTAVNTKQYPCGVGEEIHSCGTLLSGAVWDTRNALALSNPSNYREILSGLAINAMKLHTGTDISGQITIDYLTLDDDDSNINNGTPHYAQIGQGFGAHNMPAPILNTLIFTYPQGHPTRISPAGGNAFTLQVIGSGSTAPIPGTAQLFLDAENDGTFAQSDLTQISPNLYQVKFPALPCGNSLRYYFSVLTYTGTVFTPSGTPANYYTGVAAATIKTVLCDDFENDKGWTASTVGSVTTGGWERGIPTNNGRGDPATDYDNTGKCYVTDNRIGDFDIDGGNVLLTTPTLDCSGAADAYVSYARWFSNNFGSNPNSDTMVVQASGNNGASWVTVETVGPATDNGGGWKFKTFRLGGLIPLTSAVKIRFNAGDTGAASTVEAAIDAFKLELINCTKCPADFDLNGFVNGDDYDFFSAAFEAGDCAADYDSNGFVNGDDYDAFSAAFEAGC